MRRLSDAMAAGLKPEHAPNSLRRMTVSSLPNLTSGLNKAAHGLLSWHSKVLARKVARQNERQIAHKIAESGGITYTRRASAVKMKNGVWTPTTPTSPNVSSSSNFFGSGSDDDDDDDDNNNNNDMRMEGNLHFYHDDSLLKREHLRNHIGVLHAIDKWWTSFVLPMFDDDGDGNIQRSEYCGLYRVLLHSLTRLFRLRKKKSGRLAETNMVQEEQAEWENDSGGQGHIDRDRFRTVIFELVDIWCDSISADAYIQLTNSIFQTEKNLQSLQQKK